MYNSSEFNAIINLFQNNKVPYQFWEYIKKHDLKDNSQFFKMLEYIFQNIDYTKINMVASNRL